ncbi:MAG: hypothetical protein H8D67_10175 [Deltaproteobacteria bacterium]|nr:hypothetical protein [Deltaproteobacteria bacterium]
MRNISVVSLLICLVLIVGVAYSQGQIKAVLLKSAGSDLPFFWDHLNNNWSDYGSTEIIIDYSSLNKERITYGEIVETQAQVLIIDDASNPQDGIFSQKEVSAIRQYVEEGHGLIITGGTFCPWEHQPLLSLLGFSQYADGQLYSGAAQPDTIDIIVPNHPLFKRLPTYSTASRKFYSLKFYSGSDWDGDGYDGYPGDWESVLVDPDAKIVGYIFYLNYLTGKQESSPICVISKTDYRAVFAGHTPANGSPTVDDYQFYYNMIVWTGVAPLKVGDLSGDRKITAYDASLVLQAVVGHTSLPEGQRRTADVTGGGNVNALDVALILQYAVGLITIFPVDYPSITPTLHPKTENQALAEAIAQLEKTSLTKEQKQVLEGLKRSVKKELPKAVSSQGKLVTTLGKIKQNRWK